MLKVGDTMSVKSESKNSESTALVPVESTALVPVEINALQTKVPNAMASVMSSATKLQFAFMMLQETMTRAIDASHMAQSVDILAQGAVKVNSVKTEVEEVDEVQKQLNAKIKRGSEIIQNLGAGVKTMALNFIDLDIGKMIQMSDAMTTLKVRLNGINDGMQSTDALNQKIYRSAQNTRTSYADMADTMLTLGSLSEGTFSSNDDMLYFAEQMNKQFKLGAAPLQEQQGAMDQLMQSMAAGAVQAGTMENIMRTAPELASSIASYMGVSVDELGAMASQGLITSDVIKNAMYTVAGETDKKFKALPVTFAELGVIARDLILNTLMPVIELLGAGAQFVHDNWSVIVPILYGVAAAVAAYTLAQNLANISATIAALKTGVHTGFIIAKSIAMAILALATGNVAMAQQALNTAIAANPLGFIIVVIGVVIALIAAWVRSVGGIKIAWLMFVNMLFTTLENIHLAFIQARYKIGVFENRIEAGLKAFGMGFRLFFAGLKKDFFVHLENIFNGAIDMINDFGQKVNRAIGIPFKVMEHVTFGAKAKIEYEAYKKEEEGNLAKFKESQALEEEKWLEENKKIELKYRKEQERRRLEIEALQKEQALKREEAKKREEENKKGAGTGVTAQDSGYHQETANNTGSMAESMKMSQEDLSSLRLMAEQDVINRFTTAEIKLDMHNTFGDVRETADLDGIFEELERRTIETVSVAAEGAY